MAMHLPTYFTDNLWYIFLVASFITFPLAWIADGVFKDRAFGVIGNYVLLIVGSLVGVGAFMLYSGSASRSIARPELSFFAAAVGASVIILMAGLLKRAVGR